MVPALLLLVTQASAKDALREVLTHYQSLETFATTIHHEDSSGLYPGKYVQSLKWKKGGHFELKVTKPASNATRTAPDFYADGKQVTKLAAGVATTDPLETRPNFSPGWEVAGGPILSSLQRTETLKMLLEPPAGFSTEYRWGTIDKFDGQPVRDAVLVWKAGEMENEIHLYLAKSAPQLVAISFRSSDGKTKGQMVYRDQQENPKLPDTLGQAPKRG